MHSWKTTSYKRQLEANLILNKQRKANLLYAQLEDNLI